MSDTDFLSDDAVEKMAAELLRHAYSKFQKEIEVRDRWVADRDLQIASLGRELSLLREGIRMIKETPNWAHTRPIHDAPPPPPGLLERLMKWAF